VRMYFDSEFILQAVFLTSYQFYCALNLGSCLCNSREILSIYRN